MKLFQIHKQSESYLDEDSGIPEMMNHECMTLKSKAGPLALTLDFHASLKTTLILL